MIAAIYARKSTEQIGVSDEARSVTRQIANAHAYATRKGWTVDDGHVYVDDGISGAEFKRRPGLQRLLATLSPRPPFQVLIVSEQKSLAREQFGAGTVIKQLAEAGVEVWSYLDDQSLTPRNWIDKAMFSIRAAADEAHREQTSARVHETFLRKAQAGHVVGGTVFGYRNRDVFAGVDAHGRPLRSHVEREIDPVQAAIVRQIFERAAAGVGKTAIAKQLNAEHAPAPNPGKDRPRSWAPTTVREVLFRELYRGVFVWNRTKKRPGAWGAINVADRPESDWIRVDVPELRIVDEALWRAAHARLDQSRKLYLRGTKGKLCGRPVDGIARKYLLVGLARCGVCGGSIEVCSRRHGRTGRVPFYRCANQRRRGPTVCSGVDVPMVRANEVVLHTLERDPRFSSGPVSASSITSRSPPAARTRGARRCSSSGPASTGPSRNSSTSLPPGPGRRPRSSPLSSNASGNARRSIASSPSSRRASRIAR